MRMLLLLLLLFAIPGTPVQSQTPTRYPVQFTGQYRGSWTYSKGDMVVDKKIAWSSLQDNNKGHTPGVSPAYWQLAGTPPVTPTPNPTPPPPPPPAGSTPALIAHSGSVTGTTPAVNTTGANFAVVCAPTGKTIIDSMNNKWQFLPATSQGGYSASNAAMYVAFSLQTSAAHTFQSADGTPLTVMAFSHIASGPDKFAVQGSPNSSNVGPLTPTNPNELVVGCFNGNMNPPLTVAPTVVANAPYTVLDIEVPNNGNAWPNGTASAYAVFSTPSSTEIDFTSNQRNGSAESMASFFSTASPAPISVAELDPLPEAVIGTPYGAPFSCPAGGGGVQPYHYAWSGLPSEFTWDANNGCITSASAAAAATDAPVRVTLTDAQGKTATAAAHLSVAAKAITLAGGACPVATQLKPYSCSALAATGGIGALHYSNSSDPSYAGLPGGISVNAATGVISSPKVMDQGDYSNVGFSVCDSHGGCAAMTLALNIDGDNTFGGVKLFPADSVYHLKVRDLPNDTTIRGQIPTYYSGVALQAEFGPGTETGGVPVNTFAADTPFVPVKTDFGGNQFTSGPIPCSAGMEGDRNWLPQSEATGSPDLHVLGVYLPGKGADGQVHPAQLWEMYNTFPLVDTKGGCSWGNPKDAQGGGYGGARFPRPGGADTDVQTSYEMPNPGATVDAAGLPVAALLATYDEVAGGCARGAECGVIKHPIRMTVGRLGQFYQWPATASAPVIHDNCPQAGWGGGDIQPWDQAHPPTCFDGNGNPITTQGQTTVTAGQIFHLPPGTPEPPACAANPVNHILFQALVDYGVIPADNGLTGRLIGTKDNRWPDWGTLNACLTQFKLGQMVVANVSGTAVDPKYGSSQVKPQFAAPTFTPAPARRAPTR